MASPTRRLHLEQIDGLRCAGETFVGCDSNRGWRKSIRCENPSRATLSGPESDGSGGSGGRSSEDRDMSYGPVITLETARKAAAAAMAEVRRNGWTMAVAVVDTAGDLVYFEKMDDTQVGSVLVCQDKARSAARFKRPTKAFQDMLTSGGEGLRVLRIKGAVPVEGGLPITIEGKIVGAIGLSGGTSAQDGQCAKAGVDAVG
jgi:glc operon protein GlcG